ncbi:bifunctional phosphatase PAP2/diacylglycerol kinase family protein [Actinomadura sp. WMMA1423]|uniref:bifunctional phosphatase PAP2/diacylglycerol kinase family protein n=1 Tax=Actinomadura sp. WMMA1423 TaxID=2591108 RepID=UPI001F1042F8|nr:bifunctional phosphatase PAP2/diacylglycerol kinase family protein [Actinomadura sp. WMMA1423]
MPSRSVTRRRSRQAQEHRAWPQRVAVLRKLGRMDRWAFDQVAAARLPGLEYVLPRLSRFADNGVLWFSTAGAMGIAGRPRLRRAALRGAIAIAVASPAVNIVGKQAFRRRRPVVDLVPPIRIRWKLPTSHAFPSGHSASAAAFATGVALEAPRTVAVPVAATAAAVAFSRVYTGAHYPGDVMAGLGIGALAGLGTRLVWPARPAVACVAPAEPEDEDVRTAPDGRGVVAVVNLGAGPSAERDGRILPKRAEIAVALLEGELPAAEIVRLDPDDDLDKACAEAAERAEVLAVVGGDGTVNAAARAALDRGLPLLIVPGGTFDHFSRALGVETAAQAIRAYRERRIGRADVSYVAPAAAAAGDRSEQVFLNTASIGAYTEVVDRRVRLEGRIGKWPALAVAAVRALRHSEPVELMVDGRRRQVWLAFVGNCVYGSRGAAPTWRERLDDGRLDVRMVTTGGRAPRVRAVAAIIAGHLHVAPGYGSWRTTGMEVVSPAGELRLARDGELASLPPAVRFGKHPRALRVFTVQAPALG